MIRLFWQWFQNVMLHSDFNSFKQKWAALSMDNLLFKSSLSALQRKTRTLPGNDTMPSSQQGVKLEKRTKMQGRGQCPEPRMFAWMTKSKSTVRVARSQTRL